MKYLLNNSYINARVPPRSSPQDCQFSKITNSKEVFLPLNYTHEDLNDVLSHMWNEIYAIKIIRDSIGAETITIVLELRSLNARQIKNESPMVHPLFGKLPIGLTKYRPVIICICSLAVFCGSCGKIYFQLTNHFMV